MFYGNIALRTKQQGISALNTMYISQPVRLFVFDDALAFASHATLGEFIRVLGPFVGHGLGAVGAVVRVAEGSREKHKPGLPEDLTVEQLSSKAPDLCVLRKDELAAVTVTRAYWPLVQNGRPDITVKFARYPARTLKYHIANNGSAAVRLLYLGLGDKLLDARV